MAISSIGVGSGLPLDQLLADLRKSENQALSLIQSRQVRAESRLSAYGTLKNALESLKTATDALGKADTFGALKTSVSGEAYTAVATSKAIPGEYAITVESLATKQTLVSRGVEDRTTQIGDGGTITFTVGGQTKTVDLTDTDSSLDAIVKAINSDKDLGVKATLINDGGDEPHRLLLTASDTGTKAAISSITVDGNAELAGLINFNSGTGPDAPGITERAATDAQLLINGIKITSHSNTVEGAIEGVTLNLAKASTDSSNLSVAADDSVTSKAINEFVTAYNALQSTIGALTSYNIENQTSSALAGDSLARRIQSDVRNAINVATTEGNVRSLAQLGITTNVNDGSLEVDEAKLAAALKDNMPDVQALLSGATGLSGRLGDVVETFNRSGGLISSTTDSITKNISDLQRQYDVTADRIDLKMENYRRQFSALDSFVAQMNSVSSYLSQQLSMLGNNGKN